MLSSAFSFAYSSFLRKWAANTRCHQTITCIQRSQINISCRLVSGTSERNEKNAIANFYGLMPRIWEWCFSPGQFWVPRTATSRELHWTSHNTCWKLCTTYIAFYRRMSKIHLPRRHRWTRNESFWSIQSDHVRLAKSLYARPDYHELIIEIHTSEPTRAPFATRPAKTHTRLHRKIQFHNKIHGKHSTLSSNPHSELFTCIEMSSENLIKTIIFNYNFCCSNYVAIKFDAGQTEWAFLSFRFRSTKPNIKMHNGEAHHIRINGADAEKHNSTHNKATAIPTIRTHAIACLAHYVMMSECVCVLRPVLCLWLYTICGFAALRNWIA